MVPSDFKNYSYISSRLKCTSIPFLKVKSILYEQSEPFLIKYKTSMADIDYKIENIFKKATRNGLPTPHNSLSSNLGILALRP